MPRVGTQTSRGMQNDTAPQGFEQLRMSEGQGERGLGKRAPQSPRAPGAALSSSGGWGCCSHQGEGLGAQGEGPTLELTEDTSGQNCTRAQRGRDAGPGEKARGPAAPAHSRLVRPAGSGQQPMQGGQGRAASPGVRGPKSVCRGQGPWGTLGTEPLRDALLGKLGQEAGGGWEKPWPARAWPVATAGAKWDPQMRAEPPQRPGLPHTCRTTLARVARGQVDGLAPGLGLPSMGSLPCPAQPRGPPTTEVSWSMGPTPRHLPQRVPSSPELGPRSQLLQPPH